LGAGVEAHGSAGGAVSEKKIKNRIICIRNRRDKVLRTLGKPCPIYMESGFHERLHVLISLCYKTLI